MGDTGPEEVVSKLDDLQISSLEDINSLLDELAVRQLQLMKGYIQCKENLEDAMKLGSINLAKSRYIMGNKSVSVLQLPTEDSVGLRAATTLELTKSKSGSTESLSYVLGSSPTEADSGTAKSRFKGQEGEANGGSPTKKLSQDPLKWFGVLVPQNMRQAQASYRKALDYSVECVNIQLEMDAVSKRYLKYLKKKKSLES